MSIREQLALQFRSLRYVLLGSKGGSDKYREACLSENTLESRDYQDYLGGGKEKWNQRGEFQLHFLREHGLRPDHTVLDVGCGPLRAGIHLIPYLNEAKYYGVDYNTDFINVSSKLIKTQGLEGKNPHVLVVENFNFSPTFPGFNYVLVFSVLNHCTEKQKQDFFENISRVVVPGGLVCISHATWFLAPYLKGTSLVLEEKLGRKDLDLASWGWTEANQKRAFPFILLRKALSPAETTVTLPYANAETS